MAFDVLAIAAGLIVLLLALILPGYFLGLAIFPRKSDIDMLERTAFSFVFSIVFLPLLMLVENQVFGILITQASVLASMLLLVIAGLLVWMVRTQRLPCCGKGCKGICCRILQPVEQKDSVQLLAWKN